jgi:hypothetical protein
MHDSPYSLALLRALHARHTVYVTVRQGSDTYSGVIVGIGSKLAVSSGGELIEDVPAQRVIHADIREA